MPEGHPVGVVRPVPPFNIPSHFTAGNTYKNVTSGNRNASLLVWDVSTGVDYGLHAVLENKCWFREIHFH